MGSIWTAAIVAQLLGRIYSVAGILIDVARLFLRRTAGRLPTGVDRVGLEYIRHYGDRARAVLSLGPLAAALSRADSARLFRSLLDGVEGYTPLTFEMGAKAWLWNWIKPGAADSFLLNTSHLWVDHRGYAAQLRWLGARPVFFIHDLIPISHPEYCRPAEVARHPARMRNALRSASGIVVNSRHTLETLERFAHAARLRMPPAVVAPLAPGVPFHAPGPRPLPAPYFVVVGTIEPRKNHWMLLHLWRALVERLGAAAPRLVVIGQRGWECENVVDLLERCEPLHGFVIEKNACGDRELATFLHHAQALLMPSFAEGYGMPVVEALVAGVPVIASDLAVFREISGGIPEYADPLDGRRWIELVEDYSAETSARRDAQRARIADFRPPSWRAHFAAVDGLLERLGERPPA
jgi:glycosyltransferase involved in cell wall biosynthesis